MLVSGEAGIGKSRLVAQLLKEAEGKIAVRYFAAPHQQGMPLQPVLQQMERDGRMQPVRCARCSGSRSCAPSCRTCRRWISP